MPAFGGAAFFLPRAGVRFALSWTFGFGRACFRAMALFFALIAVFFGRFFAADILVLPFALAAFLIFALLAIAPSPSTLIA